MKHIFISYTVFLLLSGNTILLFGHNHDEHKHEHESLNHECIECFLIDNYHFINFYDFILKIKLVISDCIFKKVTILYKSVSYNLSSRSPPAICLI